MAFKPRHKARSRFTYHKGSNHGRGRKATSGKRSKKKA